MTVHFIVYTTFHIITTILVSAICNADFPLLICLTCDLFLFLPNRESFLADLLVGCFFDTHPVTCHFAQLIILEALSDKSALFWTYESLDGLLLKDDFEFLTVLGRL